MVQAAAQALSAMKSTDAVDPLLEILNQRYIGWYSHLGAAQALGGIGDPQALPALIRIATGSWHLSASLAAVEALGQVGGQTAVDALKELLNSESISIRAAAIKALGKEGGRSAVGALEGLHEC